MNRYSFAAIYGGCEGSAELAVSILASHPAVLGSIPSASANFSLEIFAVAGIY